MGILDVFVILIKVKKMMWRIGISNKEFGATYAMYETAHSMVGMVGRQLWVIARM